MEPIVSEINDVYQIKIDLIHMIENFRWWGHFDIISERLFNKFLGSGDVMITYFSYKVS